MFKGALYDAGPGIGAGSPIYPGHAPGNGPCLQSVDVTHCIEVIFNAQYQNNTTDESNPYIVVLPNAGMGTNQGGYGAAGAANAQAATFESCIFHMVWPDGDPSAQAYVVGGPLGGVGTFLRILRQGEFAVGSSPMIGELTSVTFAGNASVLEDDGYAYIENRVYEAATSNPIIPPHPAATLPTIGAGPSTGTNPNFEAIEVYLPVTGESGGGTMAIDIGPSSTPSLQTYNDAFPPGQTRTLRFRLPAGWSCKFTYNNVTVGTPAIVECRSRQGTRSEAGSSSPS